MNFVLVYLGPEPEQTEELIYFVWFFFFLYITYNLIFLSRKSGSSLCFCGLLFQVLVCRGKPLRGARVAVHRYKAL